MKIFLDTIGCRLNQAEIENMAMQFRAAGHEIIAEAVGADIAIINTCTVTSSAASDSRSKMRAAARLGVSNIAATGCLATIEPNQFSTLPNVKWIISNAEKDTLVSNLLQLPQEFLDIAPLPRKPLPGLRARTRAFIKVQDGCENHCTYCITTFARGKSQSRPLKKILDGIKAALEGGTQEIVLTGVHLGSWGQDFSLRSTLANLISSILAETDVARLRLSSLEPWDLNTDFFTLWQDSRLCRHLHLPLQSGSVNVLRRMARKTTPESYAKLVESARTSIPDVAITTDVIVGFPGETEAEFTETINFIRRINFARGHVFTFSARPKTAAARMPAQVPHEIRKERNATLRAIFSEASRSYRRQFLGRTMPVLWESSDQINDSNWRMEGLTDNYLHVIATSDRAMWNEITLVKLTDLENGGLRGKVHTERIEKRSFYSLFHALYHLTRTRVKLYNTIGSYQPKGDV